MKNRPWTSLNEFYKEILESQKEQPQPLGEIKAVKGQRWLQEGFTMITNAAIIDKNLHPTTLKVYLILLMHLMKKESCFPSLKLLSEEVHLSPRQTISHIKKLEKIGYIKVERKKGGNNTYYPIVK